MRIHTIILNNTEEFFRSFASDRFIYDFATKGEFIKGEQIIIEIFFSSYMVREHFRVEVLRVGSTKANLKRVWVKVLPFQAQKIDFIHFLTDNEAEWNTKRTFDRYPVSISGAWSYKNPDLWHPCEIKDLAIGGSQFFGAVPPTAGAMVFVRFIVPSTSQTIKVASRVVWVKQLGPGSYKVGLQFVPEKNEGKYKRAFKLLRTFFRHCEFHGNSDGIPNNN
ncbi:PilZ domain-containing protein [Myxococcota bacterium]|nr:PilZ domain-containing protein [Myxococcota bacterium]MBU1534065.1 PilZ domain-containing protein [Myxococcota bacterium]